MMNESFGWRGKIGLIINSGQVITEPLYNRLAPPGVGIYASRILVEGSVLNNHLTMEKEAFRAARELATAEVDCLAYCCTFSGVLQGIEGDKKFCQQLAEETGIPTTSTLAAIFEALALLRLRNIVLISPYEEKTHDMEGKFLQANGFRLVKSQSMGITSRKQRTSTTPDEIFRFCRENWDEEADGVFISCMNFNAMPCIAPLEKALGKPVLSSHSATLWKVLRMIGIREPITGFGRLLTECI